MMSGLILFLTSVVALTNIEVGGQGGATKTYFKFLRGWYDRHLDALNYIFPSNMPPRVSWDLWSVSRAGTF